MSDPNRRGSKIPKFVVGDLLRNMHSWAKDIPRNVTANKENE